MKNSHITVTDQFCGAGGSSQGVRNVSKKIGGGVEVKLALNHWKLAIETHNTNFPDTLHDCTDIQACDPRRYPSTDILITSPECTNHSLAKGKKRKSRTDLFTQLDEGEERSRATMWDVPRFAEYHRYELIIVENVVDARYWVMWDSWLMAMHSLGYNHKCVYYNSMHAHPTPQSRDRIYVVFWKKGNKAPNLELRPIGYCVKCSKDTETFQSWKKPNIHWGKYRQQYVYRCPSCSEVVEPYYYSAFNCIDWTIPGTRIGDREKLGMKELSQNTISRINFGREKFWNQPQIISPRYTSGLGSRVKSAINEELPTQPGDQSHALLNPIITTTGYPPLLTSKEYDVKNQRVRNVIDDPYFTQSTHQNIGVVMPFIVGNKGESKSRSVHALITDKSFRSFLANYYGTGHTITSMTEAARTFSTNDRAALVTEGRTPRLEDCYYRMLLAHEIQLGMAFDADYIVKGNSKQKVKQLGNAVTPPVMEDLTARCIETLM